MSNLKFIEASEKDQGQCLEMIRTFYDLEDYPYIRTKAEKNFKELTGADHLGRFWILMLDDKTIGYLILTFGYSFEYGGRDAFIDEFFLKEEFRGKGHGTKILKSLDERAKALGVNAVHLEVEKGNTVGNRLYTKSGYSGNQRSLLTKVLN